MEGWKYYNHAAIPTTPPHVEVDLACLEDKSIWRISGKPLFARWVSDFDCGYETEWWYVIKDTPLDITALKAKRRYEIKKGKSAFSTRTINPQKHKDELFNITVDAYSQWPEKYRPHIDKKSFGDSINSWDKYVVFGSFSNENGELCGYAIIQEMDNYAEFSVLRVMHEYEKKAINAAIIMGILEYYEDRLRSNFYINDGSRSIRHETAFQDYLEKYFDFRKAYCKLHIKYRLPVRIIVKALFPIRNRINNESSWGSLISGVLKMEEIRRKCE